MREGFIWENDQREGLTCKRAKGGGALYRIEERGRGFWQSCHPLPPPFTGNRGGRRRAPAALGRRPWGLAAAENKGKRRRAPRGVDPPP